VLLPGKKVWGLSLTTWKMLHSPLKSVAMKRLIENWNAFVNRCYDHHNRTTIWAELGKYLRLESLCIPRLCNNRTRLGPIDCCKKYEVRVPLLHRLAICQLSRVIPNQSLVCFHE
jgi:hypothetical protein